MKAYYDIFSGELHLNITKTPSPETFNNVSHKILFYRGQSVYSQNGTGNYNVDWLKYVVEIQIKIKLNIPYIIYYIQIL